MLAVALLPLYLLLASSDFPNEIFYKKCGMDEVEEEGKDESNNEMDGKIRKTKMDEMVPNGANTQLAKALTTNLESNLAMSFM
jgi:hypothetical protein